MNETKGFLDSLFEKEQITIDAGNVKARFNEYNSLASELQSYMNDFSIGLNLPVLKRPNPDIFYEEDAPFPNKRHLYKITEYDNKKYERFWACYVSQANPYIGITKLLSDCFIVARIENKLKIVAKFQPDYDNNKWSFRGGDRTIDYYKLGTLRAIERIMSPVNDDWSIEEYSKNT